MISRTDDLEILLAVIDSGGFSAAARQLDLQVARVSRAVTRLENELDCTLLNRTTRRIELTEEGRLFIEAARAGLDRLAEAEDLLRTLKGTPSGRLRVDAATPFLLHQLVPLTGGFRASYPEVQLELMTSESIIDLIERRTDVAIRIGELSDSNLHARVLGRSPLHIVASPDYLKSAGIPATPAELQSHDLIGFAETPSLNRWPLAEPLEIQPSLCASSGETIRQLCLAGQGIALLSRFMIAEDLAQGRLITILEHEMVSPNRRERVQAVYYRNTALSSRISAYLDYIEPRLTL
ncbi:LysR family transcriptional regulator [Marinobacterium rhizophilum]|uniref:LysR family transcriptional regulator n=1 Tax=Marinobacterium rhizophilum TaxID=420402 RepID=A0ABY5HTC2_9GAMM|nr:LysR family transcriptional regulator [Marinobacterium rhizophilum]UTW14462.1 LysR family transcriptional regulator [Marinobacterium rhizophilum]